jgi:hypothetical protein
MTADMKASLPLQDLEIKLIAIPSYIVENRNDDLSTLPQPERQAVQGLQGWSPWRTQTKLDVELKELDAEFAW